MPKDRRMEMLNIMAFVPCVTGMALPTFASEKKEIYVSPNGSDNSEGGATPYNAESAHVPMTKAKEAFHFLVEFFCKIINFFGGIFGK